MTDPEAQPSSHNRSPRFTRAEARNLFIAFSFGALIGLSVFLLTRPQPTRLPYTLETQTAIVASGTTLPPPIPLPTATPVMFIEVVIAVQDIPRGETIQANAVDVAPWLYEIAPVASYSNVEDVVGSIARVDIRREQPILSPLIARDYQSLALVADYPQLPRGTQGDLPLETPVEGEINHVTWLERWTFTAEANTTITLKMQATGGDLMPFLMLWTENGEWVEGERMAYEQTMWVTFTLPTRTLVHVHATRARTNNGRTVGTYALSAAPGYFVATPTPEPG